MSRWRTLTVNHVNILPPYTLQIGPIPVGADIDMARLIGQVTKSEKTVDLNIKIKQFPLRN